MRRTCFFLISNRKKKVFDNFVYLHIEATIGPQALAKAPKERNIPVITPFWFSGPIFVTRVIMHVTTMAVAARS